MYPSEEVHTATNVVGDVGLLELSTGDPKREKHAGLRGAKLLLVCSPICRQSYVGSIGYFAQLWVPLARARS